MERMETVVTRIVGKRLMYRDLVSWVGISSAEILRGERRKGVVAEEVAGKLVTMAVGQSVTYRITRKRVGLPPIERSFPRARSLGEVNVRLAVGDQVPRSRADPQGRGSQYRNRQSPLPRGHA